MVIPKMFFRGILYVKELKHVGITLFGVTLNAALTLRNICPITDLPAESALPKCTVIIYYESAPSASSEVWVKYLKN